MKSLYVTILLPLLLLFAGCGKDDTLPQPITGRFDPIFAQVLQERGYIADADRIALDEVKEIAVLDLSGRWDPELQKYDGPLTSLRGIEYFESLEKLNCSGNQLTTLNVSKNTALTDLNCGDNQLTSLDVSKNTFLTDLNCYSNQLTSLDVSKNTFLADLNCSDTQLTTLDVSKNTALINLYCSGNQLTTLDVSKNAALTILWCGYNRLTSLDISNNTELSILLPENNPGDGTQFFPVTAWFDNDHLPKNFLTGSWDYNGTTITIDYRKAE